MSESPHPIEGAFAVCQHPYGEGVWWHLKDGDDGSECIQECGCTPLVAVPLSRLQEVEGELEDARDARFEEGCDECEARRESAETRLREAAADFERRRNAAYELVDANRAAEFQRGAAYAFEFAAEALRTDPNPTEPMASGAAEKNSQGTSDSEDKAVPGLATEGDDG